MLSLAFDSVNMMASGSSNGTIYLWNTTNGVLIRTLNDTGAILSVAFDNGQILATGSYDNIVKLWNKYTGVLLTQLIGHFDQVRSVAFIVIICWLADLMITPLNYGTLQLEL